MIGRDASSGTEIVYLMALQKQPPWSWNAVVGKVAIDNLLKIDVSLHFLGVKNLRTFALGPIFGRLTLIGGMPVFPDRHLFLMLQALRLPTLRV
jgi:hypothetical protein